MQQKLSDLDFGEKIINHKQTDDSRVYFYDVGIGELLDKYAVYSIRAMKQRPIDRQSTNYFLNKLAESIESKINRSARNKPIRQHLTNILKKLIKVNSEMWKLRNTLAEGMSEPASYTAETALLYFELSDERDKLKNEADLVIEGRSRITRVYAH